MAEHSTLTSLFSDIADSIRAKTGENRVLIADEFPDEIAAIPATTPVPPVPPDITWTRPATYPDLDSLAYPNDANEMYFTIDRTKGTSSTNYSFSITKDNDYESLTFGHIENGAYVADTENLMVGDVGKKTINFADYPSDILLGKFSYSDTSNIQASRVSNKCIIESYVNWTGASNDGQLLFVGENLKYIKFICYNNTYSSLSLNNRFSNCNSLQSINFGNNFDTSSVTDMSGMFQYCYSLQSINFGNNFDTSGVTNMNSMFKNCYSLQFIDFGNNFNTSSVTNMSGMFNYCKSLQSLDLSTFDTSRVTDMSSMFYLCNSLQSLDFGNNFDTSSVTNMKNMFDTCSSLQSIDFGNNFDTSSVTDMSAMFRFCRSLQSLDLSTFDTSSVTNMNSMFNNCSLQSLDLSTLNTSRVTNMGSMFQDCLSLKSINFGTNFDTSRVTTMSTMFYSCSSLQHRTFIDIMNILPVVTTTQTMQFGISKYKVDPEDIAIGTAKGWTITFA